MRIAFVTTLSNCAWGGSELLWTHTARRALDDGHDVAIVATRTPEPAPHLDDLERRGARLFLRARPRKRWRGLIQRAVREFGGTRTRWLRALDRWMPELIVVNQGGTFQVTRDLALRTALGRSDAPPYALICHHNADGDLLSDDDRAVAHRQFADARWVAFVAESNRRAAERQLAMPVERAFIAQSPVNLASPGALPWPPDTVVRFACVARLDARIKAQEILLHALGGAEWADRRFELHFYGKGSDLAYLEAVCGHVGIGSRVTFHGHVNDVETIWRENHALVLPSRSEGTPLVAIEAMLCARPSIATAVGGLTEWIDEPGEGFVAEAPTVTSFAAAMNRAWAERSHWSGIGLAARARALRQRDPDPVGTLLTRILGR